MTNDAIDWIIDNCDYLFYRMYVWQLSQWKDAAIAANTAGANVGVLIGSNVISFLNLASILVRTPRLVFFELQNVPMAVVTIVWVSTFAFLYRRRGSEALAKFDNEPKVLWKKKTIYFWSYSIATGIFLLLSIVAEALAFSNHE